MLSNIACIVYVTKVVNTKCYYLTKEFYIHVSQIGALTKDNTLRKVLLPQTSTQIRERNVAGTHLKGLVNV